MTDFELRELTIMPKVVKKSSSSKAEKLKGFLNQFDEKKMEIAEIEVTKEEVRGLMVSLGRLLRTTGKIDHIEMFKREDGKAVVLKRK